MQILREAEENGMLALAMAIGGYLTNVGKGSVYDHRGILTI
jgi:hypothetical protein